MMTSEQKRRYARQIQPGCIGEEGQRRLLLSCVLVVGCGALGSMVAVQLAAAGIGRIVLADFDTVDVSNLQRQYFFKTRDAGRGKARLVGDWILELNPDVGVVVSDSVVTEGNIDELMEGVDFVVDATDNPASKYMIENHCSEKGIPCTIGGVSEFHGQIITILPGSSGFREIFGDAEQGFMPCSAGGVMGSAAALCASLQAAEVIKLLSGRGKLMSSQLFTFDLTANSFQTFNI